ncbi:MAG: trehalose-6-phosphate synthase [Anaerolineaceae bacterium]|nr:trehalose-6-phosphate synthase [Anaerolineaceae bacterium]
MELKNSLKTDRFSEIIIVSNRGPVTISKDEQGDYAFKRGSGGLVTALTGLAHFTKLTWVACALSPEDAEWKHGQICLEDNDCNLGVYFINPDPQAYDGYYNQISNPLLWFLQHSMWDIPRSPIIDQQTWIAWDMGYQVVNRQFAKEIAEIVRKKKKPVLIMLQDYHLYLTARYLKKYLRGQDVTISLFVHIPWPGPEYWGILPARMREELLDGLAAVDLMGFQTSEDGLNFIRTCENYLPKAIVQYRNRRVRYRSHDTIIRDFPISIDVNAIEAMSETEEVNEYQKEISRQVDGKKMILRVDRLEPSKNIIRGFQAYESLLENHSEYRGKVIFMAYLIPSRVGVEEYQNYLDEIMVTVGRINAHYGSSDWEPIRLLVGENYPRAVAAMKMYDVLLVNSIADGMNLVAKEGPIVNQKDGVLILSERAGARQQLHQGALVISPVDIFETQVAIHKALSMNVEEKQKNVKILRKIVREEDINFWLKSQLEVVNSITRKSKSRKLEPSK